MKTVRIPTNANPFVITINGAIYSYPAGTVQSVPDNIAAIIEQYNDSIPQEAEEQGEIGDVWTKTEEGAEWNTQELFPEFDVSDKNKVLSVDTLGEKIIWRTAKEVPSSDGYGQFLRGFGNGCKWYDVMYRYSYTFGSLTSEQLSEIGNDLFSFTKTTGSWNGRDQLFVVLERYGETTNSYRYWYLIDLVRVDSSKINLVFESCDSTTGERKLWTIKKTGAKTYAESLFTITSGGGVEAVNFYEQYEDALGDSTKLATLVEDVCTAIDAGKIAYIQYTGHNSMDENVTISGSMPIIKSADIASMGMKEIKFITPKIREASVVYLIRIFSSNGSGTLFKYAFELTEVTE